VTRFNLATLELGFGAASTAELKWIKILTRLIGLFS
jgi:hypothetical protein